MEIILTLVDNATKELKGSMDGIKESVDGVKSTNDAAFGEMQKSLEGVKKKAGETNKNMSKGFKEASNDVKRFRSDLMLVIGAFLAVSKATTAYAKYNDDARKSLNEFDLAVEQLSVSFGKLANTKLPGVKKSLQDVLTMTVNGYKMLFDLGTNALTGKGWVLSPDNEQIENIVTATQEIKDAADQQKKLNEQYITGKMSVEEYYEAIMSGGSLTQSLRQREMQEMQEIAMMEMELGNAQHMENQRIHGERMALLNEYKENYNIAHQGMMAFTVMLSQTIRTHLTSAITEMIMGLRSTREIWKELGKAMIEAIVNFMAEKAVAWVLEKTLLAGTVAASTAAGASVASAWAPAATAVSLATFGANAAPAAAGILATASTMAASMAILSGSGAASNQVGQIQGLAGQFTGGSSPGGIGSFGGGGDNGFLSQFGPIGKVVSWAGGFASGGDFVTDRPTMFVAGEAGPERVTVTPTSSQSESRGNVYIDIKVDRPTVARESDIDYLVEEISTRLYREVERIR